MHDCGSVVFGVDSRNRVEHARAISVFAIPHTHALVDCVGEKSALDMHFLTEPYEKHCHSRVLTHRKPFFFCERSVVKKHTQSKLRVLSALVFKSGLHCLHARGSYLRARRDEIFDAVYDLIVSYGFHRSIIP